LNYFGAKIWGQVKVTIAVSSLKELFLDSVLELWKKDPIFIVSIRDTAFSPKQGSMIHLETPWRIGREEPCLRSRLEDQTELLE
jgi:hypothetical protein